MNTQVATLPITTERRSVLVSMASRYSMEPAAFEQTLRATVFPATGTREQFAAFLVVANEYGLNPLTKEIYAFPAKGGGVVPIVSIDGWCNLINSHPMLNGIEFDDHVEMDKVSAITARIWRKDRDKPIVVTEYLAECNRPTDPWKQYPRRMLRHKALIQCARYAFGFAGIVDPDEAERMGADVSPMRTISHDDGPPPPPPSSRAAASTDRDVEMVEAGRFEPGNVVWEDERAAESENEAREAAGDAAPKRPARIDLELALKKTTDVRGVLTFLQENAVAIGALGTDDRKLFDTAVLRHQDDLKKPSKT
jgi:phage recombination protein Bet